MPPPLTQTAQLTEQMGSTVNVYGDILVDARETPPEEMFGAVLKVAQRKAQNRFGTTKLWSQVQE